MQNSAHYTWKKNNTQLFCVSFPRPTLTATLLMDNAAGFTFLITSRKFCYYAISTETCQKYSNCRSVVVDWLTYGVTGQGLRGVMDSWCPSIALNCENVTLGSAITESHEKVLILQRHYSISTTSIHGSHHIFTREIARWQRRQPWPEACEVQSWTTQPMAKCKQRSHSCFTSLKPYKIPASCRLQTLRIVTPM